MKKDSEASAVLQERWRENEEGRKHALCHRLGDTGPPGQAPESLEDLAWREGGRLEISSCNPGGDNDCLGRGSGCVVGKGRYREVKRRKLQACLKSRQKT